MARPAGQQSLRGITLSVNDQARDLFFARYVHCNARTYDYISSVDFSMPHLAETLEAASLAYFSTQVYSPTIMTQARERYISALHSTSLALQTPGLTVHDTTLIAVLLLDLFEKMAHVCRTPDSWSKHIEGAIALAQLRGQKQFQSPLGTRIFVQLNSTILILCLQHTIRVPQALADLRRQADTHVDVDPKWMYSEQIIMFVDLLAAMKEQAIPRTGIIARARHIDAELSAILSNMPPDWKYDTIGISSVSKHIYGDHFDVYSDHKIAHTWNNIRLLRIILNDMIEANLQFERSEPQLDERRRIEILCEEICASVPQYVYLSRHDGQHTLSPSAQGKALHSGTAKQDTGLSSNFDKSSTSRRYFTPFEISRCYSLIYPLYVAGQCSVCPEAMRRWIFDRLIFMGSAIGIREAVVASGYLDRRERVNPWCVYAQIGSYSFSV